MKFFGVLCIFFIVAHASTASISQNNEPTYGLRRLHKRAADPDADAAAYADAYAEAYANAVANALARATGLSNADAIANAVAEAAGLSNSNPVPNAAANAVALPSAEPIALPDDDDDDDDDGDDVMRPRRFTCDVLSVETAWFSVNHAACAVRCLAQRRRGGRCENGVCICR
ncbi:uncharacterized protein LOC117219453 [Megalopta genalis]|uniref:uncharacterized protein LOC117219453 n=1 Tax=Megalopta genalis TaxID=115081 RepID=UPI003FD32B90